MDQDFARETRDLNSWNPGAMESGRGAMRDSESVVASPAMSDRVQNEKVGLHPCDVGRECNDIALLSDASELASWKWESAGHVVAGSDGSLSC